MHNVQSFLTLYLGQHPQKDEIKDYQTSQVTWADRNWENVLSAGISQGADEDDWKTTLLPALQGVFSIH